MIEFVVTRHQPDEQYCTGSRLTCWNTYTIDQCMGTFGVHAFRRLAFKKLTKLLINKLATSHFPASGGDCRICKVDPGWRFDDDSPWHDIELKTPTRSCFLVSPHKIQSKCSKQIFWMVLVYFWCTFSALFCFVGQQKSLPGRPTLPKPSNS